MTDPNRADRIGAKAPWPKGKPRNDPTAWLAIRTEVQELLVEPDYEGCYAVRELVDGIWQAVEE